MISITDRLKKIIPLGLIATFCILPFSNFFLKQKADIWHAQGYFLQFGILLLYCLKLFKRSKPLACLFFWAGLVTLANFINITFATKHYPIVIFFPFFNFLCGVILFDLITEYLTPELYRMLLKSLAISIALVVGYCILQKLSLDQFFHTIDGMGGIDKKDAIVGTIGNPMHSSHYLAMALPVFFLLEKKLCKLAVIVTLAVIFLTGSASGIVIALIALIFYSFFHKVFSIREIILASIAFIIALIWKHPNLSFFGNAGRFEIWQKFYPEFSKKSITGWGLGIVNSFAKQQNFAGWRHLHNEFYHYSIEIGVIGLGLILWGVVDYFRLFWKSSKDKLSVATGSIFLGFTLSSLTGYPSHLFLLASMGILSYSFFYLKEKSNGG